MQTKTETRNGETGTYVPSGMGTMDGTGPAVDGTESAQPVNRKATRTRSKDLRKREPEEQGAFLFRMVRSAARRAKDEDPERGLKMLLDLQRRVDELVAEVGADLVAQVGQQNVADGLGWSKQRVYKRWGTRTQSQNGGE